MYELKSGDTFLRLSEDLGAMVYGNSLQSYTCPDPIQFDWTGFPVTPRNMRKKIFTVTADRITVEISSLLFSVRFPGNDYCRPDERFAPDFRFTVSFSLEGGDLVIQASPIENLDGEHVSLLLGTGLMKQSTREKGSLVIPENHGLRIDFPRNDIFSKTVEPCVRWSLPVHGLFNPNGGIGVWCDDPDRECVICYNMDETATVSAYCRELYDAMANEPRTLRYMLFAKGEDFMALGKRCRQLRQASGRFKTFAEKARNNPVASELPGTVFWKHNVYFNERPAGVEKTYSLYVARPDWNENEGLPGNWTAKEVFETAKNAGFDRVAVCNTGWNRDGYDAGYPERLPVNPERGTNADFKAAAEAAQKMSKGFFLNIHDNYIDAYKGEAFKEEEMLQRLPGNPWLAYVWRGGQAYHLCAEIGLRYAKRDLPQIKELSGPGCIYIDVSGNTPLYRCWSKEHPLTRREAWLKNRELFEYARSIFGALAVEGCGTDHYADVVDIGAYGGFHASMPPLASGPVPVPVPLWQSVYHDSVLNYMGEGYLGVHGSEYRLYQALYTFLPTSFDENSKRLSIDLRETYTAELVGFEDLIPRTVERDESGSKRTRGVSRSVYSNGVEIIANFEDEPFEWKGKAISPREYMIVK